MRAGKRFLRPLELGLVALLCACSSGSSSSPSKAILSSTQDLTLDPTGQTTVVVFPKTLPATLTPGNFEADGGQLATSVMVAADTATVTWDDRVTPSDQIRAVGIGGIKNTFVPVATSDPNPPTFTIPSAMQTAGLGGDTFSVQFSGTNVVESLAEDPANWDLQINGTSLDLTGSVLDLDPVTQILTATLGTSANLHASFDLIPVGLTSVADVALGASPVTGAATGDTTAPTLLSAEQNLPFDEYGMVIDFTFDESMDPVFNTVVDFDAGYPVFAMQVDQPTEDVLRVTFTDPIVPGQDTVDLLGIVDAHGNALPNATVAITPLTTVVNGFDAGTPTVTTVANSGGDTVVATFLQAFDPDTAEDFTRWSFESPTGTPVDLSTSSFSYDLLAKTLTVTLNGIDLLTADSFTFGAAAGAPFPVDVDGEDFTLSVAGAIVGDTTPASIVSVTQDRVLDPAGTTFDVVFTEDVETVTAENTANYTFSSGANVTSATLLAGQNAVRLQVDALTLPGDHTLDVQNVADLAGNAIGLLAGNAIGSTDANPPAVTSLVVGADMGPDNDTITVVFDDDMVAAEVQDPLGWDFESPVGSAIDTSLASVSYDAGARRAILTFDGGDGINLQNHASFSLSFTAGRDLGGNALDSTPQTGTIDAEDDFPLLESVWVESAAPQNLHVRFNEPCALFDDPLSVYVVRDGTGLDVGGGTPAVVVDADLMGATLSFGVGVTAGVHTLDLRGITDLAGNLVFPVDLHPISAEEAGEPALDPGLQLYTAFSGEENDSLGIVFDHGVSTWQLFDPSNYDLTNGPSTADFSGASFSFDGDRTVTVVFDSPGAIDLDNGAYTLTLGGILSVQGTTMTGVSVDTATADAGTDMAPAGLMSGRTRLDAQDTASSVLIEFDEAVDATDAGDPLSFTIGGVNPDTVAQLGHRSVRATWLGGVSAGQIVDVTVSDLAGNAALASQAIQAEDAFGPAVIGLAGVVAPGKGGDQVEIVFSEALNVASALNRANYMLSAGGQVIDLAPVVFRYESGTNTVRLHLPDTVDLQETDTVNVMISGVRNHAGLVINPPANVNGLISGDGVGPDFLSAQANYRQDGTGLVVDLLFDEDVDGAFASDPLQYSSTGGQSVLSAQVLREDAVRLTLSAPLMAGDRIQATGAPDMAGNPSGPIEVEPVL